MAAFLMPLPGNWRTQPRRPNQIYSLHYLFWSPQAVLRVTLQDRVVDCDPGTLCWFPPGVPYQIAMQSGQSRQSRQSMEPLLRLRFQVRKAEALQTPIAAALLCPQAQQAGTLMTACAEAFARQDDWSDYERRCRLGLLAAYALGQRGEGTRGRDGHGQLRPGALAQLHAYVARHVHDRPTPADLARQLGYQPAYFRRIFRATTGLTPRRWLLETRFQLAGQRIHESREPINIIAAEFGYDDALLFSRQFKDVHGMSPTHWRQTPLEVKHQ